MEKSETELAAASERRKEQGRRLQEMQARQRSEKVRLLHETHADCQLAQKMALLTQYSTLLASRGSLPREEFLDQLLENTPFETEGELETWVKRTEGDIKRKQKRDLGEEAEPDEDPSFPLVDRPDEELNEEEIKEKRRQRLMKAGWEARVRAREEKQRERERLLDEERKEVDERQADLAGWSAKLKAEQDVGVTHSPAVSIVACRLSHR